MGYRFSISCSFRLDRSRDHIHIRMHVHTRKMCMNYSLKKRGLIYQLNLDFEKMFKFSTNFFMHPNRV